MIFIADTDPIETLTNIAIHELNGTQDNTFISILSGLFVIPNITARNTATYMKVIVPALEFTSSGLETKAPTDPNMNAQNRYPKIPKTANTAITFRGMSNIISSFPPQLALLSLQVNIPDKSIAPD